MQILVTIVSVVAYGVMHHGKSLRSAGAAIAVNGSVVSVAAILTVPVVVELVSAVRQATEWTEAGRLFGAALADCGSFRRLVPGVGCPDRGE